MLVAGFIILIDSPYNYLVDPGVREIMGINLKGAVVIFDDVRTQSRLFSPRRWPRSSAPMRATFGGNL